MERNLLLLNTPDGTILAHNGPGCGECRKAFTKPLGVRMVDEVMP
jgi:hypothetical protein